MKVLSKAEIDAALDDLALIDRLDGLFRAGCEMPVRHHHPIRGRSVRAAGTRCCC